MAKTALMVAAGCVIAGGLGIALNHVDSVLELRKQKENKEIAELHSNFIECQRIIRQKNSIRRSKTW